MAVEVGSGTDADGEEGEQIMPIHEYWRRMRAGGE